MKNIQLAIIDPQNDFCHPDGSLFVVGADEDMKRVARMIERLKDKISDIHVTLDSHRKVDISHPIWFKDSAGRHPDKFTMITASDLESGKWTTTRPSARARTLEYLRALEKDTHYPHIIWPEHCLIGDEGHNIYPALSAAIHEWEDRFASANFVTKGSNPWTEHFSAIKAEIPDPSDMSTQINGDFLRMMDEADELLVCGEALSHCLLSTLDDIVKNFPKASIQKIVLLTDATSMIPDPTGTTLFTDRVAASLREWKALGLRTATTTDYLT